MPIRIQLRLLLVIFSLGLLSVSIAEESPPHATVDHSIIPADLANNAVLLRERALLDNLPIDIVESLTTEVGPRRIGTEGDTRAIAWAKAKFNELGFDRVWTEEVPVEHGWIRGEAEAEILAPFQQNLVLTALGYSVGTDGDLVAEIVREELTGDLGERITRNVRKLVRREIHRALLTREFE